MSSEYYLKRDGYSATKADDLRSAINRAVVVSSMGGGRYSILRAKKDGAVEVVGTVDHGGFVVGADERKREAAKGA